MDVGKKVFEVENRVYHYLPGAVVGNVTATVDVVESSTHGGEVFPFHQQVLFFPAFAERKNMGVFAEQQEIRY